MNNIDAVGSKVTEKRELTEDNMFLLYYKRNIYQGYCGPRPG